MTEQLAPDLVSRRLRIMRDEAKAQVLYVAPPYADPGRQDAFLAGYEAALSDIAKGWIKVPSL